MKFNLTESQRKLFKLANMATSGSQFARSSGTGKSFSEDLILALVTHNMARDCSLNSPKNTSSQHVVYKYCFECQNKKFVYNMGIQ